MNNAQGKHYGKSLLFIAATFLVLCVWLLREYSLPKLWELILGVRPGWILAAVGLMVLYWLLEAGGTAPGGAAVCAGPAAGHYLLRHDDRAVLQLHHPLFQRRPADAGVLSDEAGDGALLCQLLADD